MKYKVKHETKGDHRKWLYDDVEANIDGIAKALINTMYINNKTHLATIFT